MKTNPIRQLLVANRPTVCTQLHSTWPSVIEVLGHTGLYDYVEFVAENAPFDLHALDNMCRAAELYGLGSMIKVDQTQQAFVAQRAVGSGFSAVLYSDCRSVDDVKACVRQTKPDTPDIGGAYGAAGRRNCYMGLSGSAEYVDSLDQVVVAVMIEKRSLVDDLEEVLSISDIDMVQWGPTDYSMNIGRPGQTDAPEVVAAHDRVFRTALEMGVRPRAEIRTASEAKRYLDMGVRHFAVGVDLNVLYDFWRGEGERIRSALEE